MNPKAKSKKTNLFTNTNPLETDRQSQSVARKTGQAISDISRGVFEDLLGGYDDVESYGEQGERFEREQPKAAPQRREFSLFNYNAYHEQETVRRHIKELTDQIKAEIQMIKSADQSLLAEVSDISKLSVESLPAAPGIYHIRFLEVVLSILRTLKQKISESKTWLEAMTSRRAKRGSLFAARSKKQGTQYSLSQELSNARSVQ